MGVYPTYRDVDKHRTDDGGETWTTRRELPGVVYTRQVTAGPWVLAERTNCFCCSCGDSPGSDPYCRNHGWAGQRPCDRHNMPGQANEEGIMPDSVQAAMSG